MQKQILGRPASPPNQFTHSPGCLTRSGRSLDGEKSGRVHAHTHTHPTSPTATHAQTHTHTNTYMHTYHITLPHRHACLHTYIHTNHTHHVCTHSHKHIFTPHTHKHMYTHKHTRTHTRTTHIPHIHRVVPGRFWKESLAQLRSKPRPFLQAPRGPADGTSQADKPPNACKLRVSVPPRPTVQLSFAPTGEKQLNSEHSIPSLGHQPLASHSTLHCCIFPYGLLASHTLL